MEISEWGNACKKLREAWAVDAGDMSDMPAIVAPIRGDKAGAVLRSDGSHTVPGISAAITGAAEVYGADEVGVAFEMVMARHDGGDEEDSGRTIIAALVKREQIKIQVSFYDFTPRGILWRRDRASDSGATFVGPLVDILLSGMDLAGVEREMIKDGFGVPRGEDRRAFFRAGLDRIGFREMV